MRDFHLMLFVFALVLIDATFITIWVYYDPLQTKDVFFDELVSAYGTELGRLVELANQKSDNGNYNGTYAGFP